MIAYCAWLRYHFFIWHIEIRCRCIAMFQTGARGFLAAILAVTSLSPMGLQHSHHGGGVQHAAHVFLTDRHQHAGHAHAHHDLEHDSELLPGATAHTHAWLLGFEITLPPGSGSDDEDDSDDVVLIRIERQSTAPDNGWIDHWPAIFPAGHVLPADTDPDAYVPEHVITPVVSVRLCDTARHERSGVQLI